MLQFVPMSQKHFHNSIMRHPHHEIMSANRFIIANKTKINSIKKLCIVSGISANTCIIFSIMLLLYYFLCIVY